jgi:hypothetical protein
VRITRTTWWSGYAADEIAADHVVGCVDAWDDTSTTAGGATGYVVGVAGDQTPPISDQLWRMRWL